MDDIAKGKMRATFAAKRARGEPTGRAPLGHMVVYDETGRFGRVVEDPDVMPLVLKARQMWEEGHSIRTICRTMHSLGLRSGTGKKVGPSGMHAVVNKRY